MPFVACISGLCLFDYVSGTAMLRAVRFFSIHSAVALMAGFCIQIPASAQSDEHAPGRPYFGGGDKFSESGGAAIYEGICQGCHMPQGNGAVGAGRYPALAGDTNLASKNYILYTVLNGRKAMPPFAAALDDQQISDVVNYVRSHFGNAYSDTLSQAEVKSARPPVAPSE